MINKHYLKKRKQKPHQQLHLNPQQYLKNHSCRNSWPLPYYSHTLPSFSISHHSNLFKSGQLNSARPRDSPGTKVHTSSTACLSHPSSADWDRVWSLSRSIYSGWWSSCYSWQWWLMLLSRSVTVNMLWFSQEGCMDWFQGQFQLKWVLWLDMWIVINIKAVG